MFPLTHLYFYSTIFPVDTGGALGSVFPDTTLLTGLKWSQTHKSSIDLLQQISPEDRVRNAGFLRGVLTHGVDSGGLDFFGDEEYQPGKPGFAYIKSKPLIDDVVAACKVPEKMGPWKAHNFIEMGIESLVAAREPRLSQWILSAKRDRQEIKSIAAMLGPYYNLKPEVFEKAIVRFIQFMRPSGSPDELAASYGRVLRIRHQVENPDVKAMARVIKRARNMMQDEYEPFLAFCRHRFLKRWPGIEKDSPWKISR